MTVETHAAKRGGDHDSYGSDEHSANHEHAHDDGGVHPHIASVKFYLGIFAALIFFTLLTVGVSYVHLGPANLAVAIAISSTKATLVVLFFMHLRHDNKFNALIFVSSLLFIGVFFAYTMNDTSHRGEVDATQGGMVLSSTGKDAPGGFPARHDPKANAPDHQPGNENNGGPATKPEPGTKPGEQIHAPAHH